MSYNYIWNVLAWSESLLFIRDKLIVLLKIFCYKRFILNKTFWQIFCFCSHQHLFLTSAMLKGECSNVVGVGERKALPWSYFLLKIEKIVSITKRFSIKNVVLKVSRRRNSKILSCVTSFPCIFDKIFIEVP